MMALMAKSSAGGSSWFREPWNVGMAVVAVAALVFASYASVVSLTRSSSSDTVSYTAPSEVAAPQVDQTRRIVFIGDSYTVGDGAPTDKGYAYLTAEQLGMRPQVNAESSSGYLTAGRNGSTQQNLIDRATVSDPAPEIVILASGYNDRLGVPPNPDLFRAAVQTAFDTTKAKWPASTIVALGPWTPTGSASQNQQVVGAVLGEESATRGFVYIDTLKPPLINGRMIGQDNINPSPEGHQEIASGLAERLRAQIPDIA